MGKKFGTNSKAEEARERKATAKKEAQVKSAKAKEDALWQETDPKVLAKQEKKKEEEAKRQEKLAKKAEAKAIEEKEREELAKKYTKPTDKKVTRALIEEQREQERKKKEAEMKKKDKEEQLLEPNINQILAEERQKIQEEHGLEVVEARSVDDAIVQLDNNAKVDKHPEKRMKAAYLSYEEKRMPSLKEENPGSKYTQLKELLWKEWQKSPENPLNQIQTE